MKIRNGFVSNSSSSSFMIVGVWKEYNNFDTELMEEKGIRFEDCDDDGPCFGVDDWCRDDQTWATLKWKFLNNFKNLIQV